MSPEFLSGGVHDKTVDIWAVGILLFELFHNKEPFSGSSAEEIYNRIQQFELDYDTHVPHSAKSLVEKILKLDASERPTLREINQDPFFRTLRNNKFSKTARSTYSNPPRKDKYPLKIKKNGSRGSFNLNFANPLLKKNNPSSLDGPKIQAPYTQITRLGSFRNMNIPQKSENVNNSNSKYIPKVDLYGKNMGTGARGSNASRFRRGDSSAQSSARSSVTSKQHLRGAMNRIDFRKNQSVDPLRGSQFGTQLLQNGSLNHSSSILVLSNFVKKGNTPKQPPSENNPPNPTNGFKIVKSNLKGSVGIAKQRNFTPVPQPTQSTKNVNGQSRIPQKRPSTAQDESFKNESVSSKPHGFEDSNKSSASKPKSTSVLDIIKYLNKDKKLKTKNFMKSDEKENNKGTNSGLGRFNFGSQKFKGACGQGSKNSSVERGYMNFSYGPGSGGNNRTDFFKRNVNSSQGQPNGSKNGMKNSGIGQNNTSKTNRNRNGARQGQGPSKRLGNSPPPPAPAVGVRPPAPARVAPPPAKRVPPPANRSPPSPARKLNKKNTRSNQNGGNNRQSYQNNNNKKKNSSTVNATKRSNVRRIGYQNRTSQLHLSPQTDTIRHQYYPAGYYQGHASNPGSVMNNSFNHQTDFESVHQPMQHQNNGSVGSENPGMIQAFDKSRRRKPKFRINPNHSIDNNPSKSKERLPGGSRMATGALPSPGAGSLMSPIQPNRVSPPPKPMMKNDYSSPSLMASGSVYGGGRTFGATSHYDAQGRAKASVDSRYIGNQSNPALSNKGVVAGGRGAGNGAGGNIYSSQVEFMSQNGALQLSPENFIHGRNRSRDKNYAIHKSSVYTKELSGRTSLNSAARNLSPNLGNQGIRRGAGHQMDTTAATKDLNITSPSVHQRNTLNNIKRPPPPAPKMAPSYGKMSGSFYHGRTSNGYSSPTNTLQINATSNKKHQNHYLQFKSTSSGQNMDHLQRSKINPDKSSIYETGTVGGSKQRLRNRGGLQTTQSGSINKFAGGIRGSRFVGDMLNNGLNFYAGSAYGGAGNNFVSGSSSQNRNYNYRGAYAAFP